MNSIRIRDSFSYGVSRDVQIRWDMLCRDQAGDTENFCVMLIDQHSSYPGFIEFRVQLLSTDPWNRRDRLNGKVPAIQGDSYFPKAVLKVADVLSKQRSKRISVGLVDPERVLGRMDNGTARLAAGGTGFALFHRVDASEVLTH